MEYTIDLQLDSFLSIVACQLSLGKALIESNGCDIDGRYRVYRNARIKTIIVSPWGCFRE